MSRLGIDMLALTRRAERAEALNVELLAALQEAAQTLSLYNAEIHMARKYFEVINKARQGQ